MKKLILSISVTALVFGATSILVQAAERAILIPKNKLINVVLDGRKIVFQGGNSYVDSENRIQVPFRGIGEAMGAKVGFSGKVVSFNKGEDSIQLTLGSKTAVVNGESITMDSIASSQNGRTFVPLRFISENLGKPVRWDSEGNMVWIGEEKFYTQEEIVGNGEDISKYASYYKGKEYLTRDSTDVPYSKVHVLTIEQLPVKIGNRVIYDMWTYQEAGKNYIAVRHSHTTPNLYFLTDTFEPRFRYSSKEDSKKKEIKTDVYSVVDYRDILDEYKNPENFNIKEVKYIGFAFDSTSIVLLKNPWK